MGREGRRKERKAERQDTAIEFFDSRLKTQAATKDSPVHANTSGPGRA